ncbi:MAG: glycerophosphodiester phosphodiesterase family protein [Xenococcaceae cyanobacterium MO_188.B29]|nr:glycerophosphodiester phosphodiesterase family protein [Xenococcaceae cyanobacterium MO_188.B29]
MMIIAHRGFTDKFRENTLEAYCRAIEVGADAIELDLRKTKDNVLILFHDELIEEKPINQLTYQEINSLASSLDFQVPTLIEVLKLVKEKNIKLDIELKEEGYETDVLSLLVEYLTIDQFIVTSFQAKSLSIVKLNYPQVKIGIILNSKTANNFESKINLITVDFLVIEVGLLSNHWLNLAETNNKSIFVWTVNQEKIIRKLLKDKRITGIITDQPDLAVHLKKITS